MEWYTNLSEGQKKTVKFIVAIVGGLALLVVFWKVAAALLAAGGIFLFFTILIAPFFVPTIIAVKRAHPSKGSIIAVNILLGWSFIGWVWALVWSLSDNRTGTSQPNVVVHVQNYSPAQTPPEQH